MSQLFKQLEERSDDLRENRDCTVKAWAVVAGLSYDEAHFDLERVGRRPGRGIHMRSQLRRLCERRGLKWTDVTIDMRRRGVKTPTSAQAKMPKRGKFLIFVKGHVAAFQGGELHDWTQGRRHRIQQIFRINTA